MQTSAKPAVLRFFFGRMKEIGNWQEKLVEKLKADFGDAFSGMADLQLIHSFLSLCPIKYRDNDKFQRDFRHYILQNSEIMTEYCIVFVIMSHKIYR